MTGPEHTEDVPDAVSDAVHCGYRPVPVAPDPERDKRVAARRALDAARAGRALDRLLSEVGEAPTAWRLRRDGCDGLGCSCCGELERLRSALGYSESELHHNGHYGVAPDACSHGVAYGLCGRIECQVGDGE